MNMKWIIPALISSLTACLTSTEPVSLDPPGQVIIDDGQLDTAHGWTTIADGVYQRIDLATGTVSTVSVGEAGRRFDHDLAQENLTLAQQQLANALLGNQDTADLRIEIAEIEATVIRLRPEPAALATNGTASEYDETPFCHNIKGTFLADFETSPRSGGGTVGTVTSDVRAVSCIGFECIPYDGFYASGYKGRTYATARASNIGGINTMSQYSNNGVSVDMYTYPSASATATTRNVLDSACSLRAGGWINTTLATTPYQSCSLYRNFTITKTCAQIL